MRSFNRSYPAHNAGVPVPSPVHTGERSPYWSRQIDRVFYVSAKDGKRHAVLLGPYETHQEALDDVQRGRDLACAAQPGAWFYAFGTCSGPRSQPLRAVFGR